jgi:hypothetical protein
MTAEAIAAVVADIRKGRVRHLADDPIVDTVLLGRAQKPQPVVDATAIFRSVEDRMGAGINLYEDFPSAVSPWDDALLAYVNSHGNVMVLQVHQRQWDETRQWDTANPVDWSRVRWLVEASIWGGGRSGGKAIPTVGPLWMLQNAIYDDGTPADLHWVALTTRGVPEEAWTVPSVVLNAALSFLSCSNVEVAEPIRPFPVRQRLRKQRVQVQTIVVRPPGKRRAHTPAVARPMDELDTQITSVRGSFATYGSNGRGLLFGKFAGKFWRPAHVRGGAEAEPRDYVLKPGAAA